MVYPNPDTRFGHALEFRVTQTVTFKRQDSGEDYVLDADKYVVMTSDGRWRVTNVSPAIWLTITNDQLNNLATTGRTTDDEQDYYDTN